MEFERELRGKIFHDPKFVTNFLPGDPAKLDAVVKYCCKSKVYNKATGHWKMETSLENRRQYLLTLVNMIRRGVYRACKLGVPTLFQDHHDQPIPSDEKICAGFKPDIVLFDSGQKHWETVRMAIGVINQRGYTKAAMRRMAWYAGGIFSHQLHRRHLYTIMMTGTNVTFMRVDRTGILHSDQMDLSVNAEPFIRAFASLMMLDRAGEGYDTAFMTRTNEQGRLDYYINLPQSAFAKEQDFTNTGSPTRTLKVSEILYHRKSICDRSTIALRIREVLNPSHLYPKQTPRVETRSQKKRKREQPEDQVERLGERRYVLKTFWRDPKYRSESEIFELLEGRFGLAQHLWHCDVPGRCHCSEPESGECSSCPDVTAQVEGMQVCEQLLDLEVTGEEAVPTHERVEAIRYQPTSARREPLVYSYVLMSSVGVSLAAAQSPREFMTAVLDAILGYWQLVNLGILHRDISAGNVLLLYMGQRYAHKKWRDPQPEEALTMRMDKDLAESEKELRKVLANMDRDPVGMLSDFDLFTTYASSPRLATPAQDNQNDGGSTSHSRPAPADEDDTPGMSLPAKKRKVDSGRSISVNAAPSHTSATHRPTELFAAHSRSKESREEVIDYRTGTEPFMSVNVTNIVAGHTYQHSYLDDVESFFWLIFWFAMSHLDPDATNPSYHAEQAMECMESYSMAQLAVWKFNQLQDCILAGGHAMKELLQLFKNEWATDPIFQSVILNLGNLCVRLNQERQQGILNVPGVVFPKLVKIFQDVL